MLLAAFFCRLHIHGLIVPQARIVMMCFRCAQRRVHELLFWLPFIVIVAISGIRGVLALIVFLMLQAGTRV